SSSLDYTLIGRLARGLPQVGRGLWLAFDVPSVLFMAMSIYEIVGVAKLVILMAAKRPEDLLLCHVVRTSQTQILRSLRSHQDDRRGRCARIRMTAYFRAFSPSSEIRYSFAD